jgi:hypothetical protein
MHSDDSWGTPKDVERCPVHCTLKSQTNDVQLFQVLILSHSFDEHDAIEMGQANSKNKISAQDRYCHKTDAIIERRLIRL